MPNKRARGVRKGQPQRKGNTRDSPTHTALRATHSSSVAATLFRVAPFHTCRDTWIDTSSDVSTVLAREAENGSPKRVSPIS